MKDFLLPLFARLNDFIIDYNARAREEGSLTVSPQQIHIVGQTALFLNELPFQVSATADLDLMDRLDFRVSQELTHLLLKEGIRLETDSHLIWMPEGTQYLILCSHSHLDVFFAHHRDVISSKCKFKRTKDEALIKTYKNFFPNFEAKS